MSQPKTQSPMLVAKVVRDRAAVLDGQVGDAARGVELVGVEEGVGRAGVEAARAGAATIPAAKCQASVARSSEVRITPRKSQEPMLPLRTQVFLPIDPMPARAAALAVDRGPGVNEERVWRSGPDPGRSRRFFERSELFRRG